MSEGLLVPLQSESGILHMSNVPVTLISVLRTKAVGCLCGYIRPCVTSGSDKDSEIHVREGGFPGLVRSTRCSVLDSVYDSISFVSYERCSLALQSSSRSEEQDYRL